METTITSSDYNVNLVINQMTRRIYDALSAKGELDPDQMYLVEDEVVDAFGKRITNVGDPVLSSDAATKGYVDNKTAFGSGSRTLSNDSYAFGLSCIAGSFGFRVISGDVNAKTWKLESADGIQIGDKYTVRIAGNYDLVGEVVAIDGSYVTVSKMPTKMFESEYYVAPDGTIDHNIISASGWDGTGDQMTMLFPYRPEVGDIYLGNAGFATGYQSMAANKYAHAEGCQTLAAGKYSHAEGLSTVAGYAAHAEGRYTVATGTWSHAEGNYCSALTWAAHAEGDSACVSDDNAYVWAGKTQRREATTNPPSYGSNGIGTFNIYPKGGIDGLYVDGKQIRSLVNNIGHHNVVLLSTSLAVGQHNSISSENSLGVGYDIKLLNGQSIAAIGSQLSVGTPTVSAHNAIALGKNAYAKNRESIVWNGINDDKTYVKNPYSSHGAGTLNLNPNNGLSGIWIGEERLADIMPQKTMIVKDSISTDVAKLKINKVTRQEYDYLSAQGLLRENELYAIDSDILDARDNWILNVKTPQLSSDAANKKYVDDHQSSLLNTSIQMIRPIDDHNLHLSVTISELPDFSTQIVGSPLDSRVSASYFYGFNVADSMSEWRACTSEGFGREYSNKPTMIDLPKLFADLGYDYNAVSHLYVKYTWHWTDGSESHHSDPYSTILPATTEVGANANDVISKRQFDQLDSQVNPQRETAQSEPIGGFRCYTTKMNDLGAVSNGQSVTLDSYEYSNSYFIKFSTANDTIFKFYVDVGNGPEYDRNMSINKNFKFSEGEYVIEVKFDNMTVSKCAYSGSGSGGDAVWGGITGDIASQTDLQAQFSYHYLKNETSSAYEIQYALDNLPTHAVWGGITGNIASQTDLQQQFLEHYPKTETSSAYEIQYALDNLPTPSSTAIRRWY